MGESRVQSDEGEEGPRSRSREGSIPRIRRSDPLVHRLNNRARDNECSRGTRGGYSTHSTHPRADSPVGGLGHRRARVTRRVFIPEERARARARTLRPARGRRTFNQFSDSAPLSRVFRRRATKRHRGAAAGERDVGSAPARHNSKPRNLQSYDDLRNLSVPSGKSIQTRQGERSTVIAGRPHVRACARLGNH